MKLHTITNMDVDDGTKNERDTDPLKTPETPPIYPIDDFSDLDTGWAWVVLFSSFGSYFLLGSALYAVGIIHATLLDRYEESISLTSWAGALHTALISLAGPLSSAISDRFSCRVAMVTAGVLYVIGYLLTAWAPNIEVAILTCGIISGTAGGIGFAANLVVITYNFRRRRNIAIGIAMSGNGLGLLFLAPVMQFFREYYGSIGFFIMLAGIFSHMILFGALCFPSKLEIYTKQQRSNASAKQLSRNNKSSKFTMVSRYLNVLAKKGIVCYCLSMFSICLATYLLYLYFPNFIVHKGFSARHAAFFVSISGIFNVAARLVTGVLTNLGYVNDIWLYCISVGVVSVISFIYPFIADYDEGQVIYFVLLGLFTGPIFVLTTSMNLRFVGLESIATAIGLEFGFGGIGALIGPVFAGFLLDNGGTYEQAIFVAASCALLAVLFAGPALCLQHNSESNDLVIECEETPASREKRYSEESL